MFTRYAFVVFAAVFFTCLLVQVFLAGLAVFVNPDHWASHEIFVHFFELLPLLMLPLGWLGRMPRKLLWQSAGLFGLIFLQYLTANLRTALPVVAAAHPVVALLLTGLAYTVMVRAWKFTQIRRST